jgi:Protein of unknown function (DUF3095)
MTPVESLADDPYRFYEHLESFSDFSDLMNDRHYTRVPAGWTVVITDIRGSTAAIEAGRYRDVNTIGAASIAAVQNLLLKTVDFPYVFGGDGATLIVPNQHAKAVAKELAALKNLSQRSFGLTLRVGMVDISEVTAKHICVEVAKYELCKGKCMAIFRGDSKAYEIPETKSLRVNLKGLTCRWNDIPSRRGRVMTLLVSANPARQPASTYNKFFDELKRVFCDLRLAHPVDDSCMTYRTVNDCVEDEKRYVVGNQVAWSDRRFEISLAVRLFTTKKVTLNIDPVPYAAAMKNHSDYQKFDDMLRMILDCSEEESMRVEEYLRQGRKRGDLSYGIHYSSASLMTCYVNGLEDGQHIHFIDGGDGGYAVAAKQLKQQLMRDRRFTSTPMLDFGNSRVFEDLVEKVDSLSIEK